MNYSAGARYNWVPLGCWTWWINPPTPHTLQIESHSTSWNADNRQGLGHWSLAFASVEKRPCFKLSGRQWWEHKIVLRSPHGSHAMCIIILTHMNMYIHTSNIYTQNKKKQTNKTRNKSKFCLAIPRQDRNRNVTNKGVTWTIVTKEMTESENHLGVSFRTELSVKIGTFLESSGYKKESVHPSHPNGELFWLEMSLM